MSYTDIQLKQALAKMLPEVLGDRTYTAIGGVSNTYLVWKAPDAQQRGITQGRPVLDTELLHLCWLVEEMLAENEQAFYRHLGIIVNNQGWCWHATWQQRVIALAKVKGVEII